MALDRSPESFSPQMNSTSLFLWFPTFDPWGGDSFDSKGHHVNKLTKVYIEMLYPFQFQRRIFKLVFVPMFQLVTPGEGSVLTPKESYE